MSNTNIIADRVFIDTIQRVRLEESDTGIDDYNHWRPLWGYGHVKIFSKRVSYEYMIALNARELNVHPHPE